MRTFKKPRTWPFQLAYLIVIAAIIGTLIYQDHQDRKNQVANRRAEEHAVRAVMGEIFAPDAGLQAVYASCASLGEQLNPRFYQTPQALAWHRNGLDIYVFSGIDTTSLVHLRCDLQGLRWGGRFERPLRALIPAETVDEPGLSNLQIQDLKLDKNVVAIELLLHPATGETITRTWSGPELSAKANPESTPDFPLLMRQGSGAFSAIHALKELPLKRWNRQASAAFELLSRELPKDAKLVELSLAENALTVYIEGPIPGFDGSAPKPFGEKNFDAYGIADASYWYPREIPGFGCKQGRPLREIVELFKAAGGTDGRDYHQAWYSCSSAYSDGINGQWRLAP